MISRHSYLHPHKSSNPILQQVSPSNKNYHSRPLMLHRGIALPRSLRLVPFELCNFNFHTHPPQSTLPTIRTIAGIRKIEAIPPDFALGFQTQKRGERENLVKNARLVVLAHLRGTTYSKRHAVAPYYDFIFKLKPNLNTENTQLSPVPSTIRFQSLPTTDCYRL